MPEKDVVMSFYSRRSKVKNKIRGQKLDSGEWANVGNGEELNKAGERKSFLFSPLPSYP